MNCQELYLFLGFCGFGLGTLAIVAWVATRLDWTSVILKWGKKFLNQSILIDKKS